jgi:thioredoxin reductase (NADPH)
VAASSFDVAVIGGGIAGLTAAQHAALHGIAVGHFVGADDLPGGLVANVGEIDGFPAVAPVSGAALAAALAEQNAALGVTRIDARIDRIEGGASKILGNAKGSWRAQQVIVATGAHLKPLAVPGAKRLLGRGVSYCAWCDGGLYRDAEVVVVGGGDAALSEALHLAKFARRITIVTRGEQFRARQHYVGRIAEDERFVLRWACDIEEVLGEHGVQAVRLHDRDSGRHETIACSGVFAFIGVAPNAALLPDTMARDAVGAAVTDATLETAMPGVFAIGAVRAGYGGRLTDAVGEATRAAELAARRCQT